MSQLFQLEKQLEDAKAYKARRDLAIKLSKNREFRELILEGFCVKDAARYVQQSSDPAMGPDERADALAMAQAGGHLKRFLSMTVKLGDSAADSIGDVERAIEEVRAEEGED